MLTVTFHEGQVLALRFESLKSVASSDSGVRPEALRMVIATSVEADSIF